MNVQTQDWKTAFESERDRIIHALGRVVDGGIVEAIQHIGATSVPGLYGSPCIDIGLAVWPFPLEVDPKSRLDGLGYRPMRGYEEGPEQRFRHETDSFELHVVEPGDERWFHFVLVRDYLRHDPIACTDFSLKKKEAGVDKSRLFEASCPRQTSGGSVSINLHLWKRLPVN